MRLLRSIHLLVLFLLVSSGSIGVSHAQTSAAGQKLLSGMIEALGGPAFLDVKEIQTTGRFFSFKKNEVAGAEVYADYTRFPDTVRTEFGKERQRTIHINKGNEGWIVSGRDEKDVKTQTPAQTEDFLSTIKTTFDYVTRFVVNAPKTTILNTGTEVVDFRRTDVIEMRDPTKNLIRFFVDRETHLPVKMQVRQANESTLYEESYGNWHRFQGVMTPMFVTRSKDGIKTMEIRADKVTYNAGFSDSLFTPPSAAK